MTVEQHKLRLAIQAHAGRSDSKSLEKIALTLLSTVAALTERQRGNYAVIDGDLQLAEGGRDYCIGYAEALNSIIAYGGHSYSCRVMVGEFQVWPDWGIEADAGARE